MTLSPPGPRYGCGLASRPARAAGRCPSPACRPWAGIAWARRTCPRWFAGVAPGCVMARALACLPWLPGWRHKVPRARCPPWHGRRDAPRAPAADDAAAEQLVTTVRDLDVGFALADSRTARTSDFTKTANSTAWPLYCLVATGGGPAGAAYDGHPGGRAAYLRVRGPTRPRRLLVVIVQHARGLSLFCAADRAGADSVVLGLERDMPNTDGLRRLLCPSFAS